MLTDSLILILLNESTLLKEGAGSATWHCHWESLAKHTQQTVSLNIVLGRSKSLKEETDDFALLAILELLVLTLKVMKGRDGVDIAIGKPVEQSPSHREIKVNFSWRNIALIYLHGGRRRWKIHKRAQETTLLVKGQKELSLTEDSRWDELEKAKLQTVLLFDHRVLL